MCADNNVSPNIRSIDSDRQVGQIVGTITNAFERAPAAGAARPDFLQTGAYVEGQGTRTFVILPEVSGQKM